jgi:hypothetical protein
MKARLIFKDGSSRLVDDIETVEMVKERVHIGPRHSYKRLLTMHHMQILRDLAVNPISDTDTGRLYLRQLIDGGYIQETANVRIRTDKGNRLLRSYETRASKKEIQAELNKRRRSKK